MRRMHTYGQQSTGQTLRMVLLGVVAAVGLMMSGCIGQMTAQEHEPGQGPGPGIDAPKPEDPDNPVNPLEPNAPKGPDLSDPDPGVITPATPHLRRLTAEQFANTVIAALGDIFEEQDWPNFGDDIPTIGLSNDPSLLRINPINIDSLYQATQAIAVKVTSKTPYIADCVKADGDGCFVTLVDELGLKLWRRPLNSEEREDLLRGRQNVADASGSRAEQAQFIVQALLISPNMLYRTELGAPAESDASPLTDYELASALSYTMWNAPPDDELMQLAAMGQLRETETLVTQAKRMAEDPRLAAAMAEFYVDYLKLDAIFGKEKNESLGLTLQARTALLKGIREDLVEIFAVPDATLLDPFSTNTFRVDEHSATFFGVPVESEGFVKTSMDPTQRLGVLSHPAFLSVHSGVENSGIVKRGVFTLEQLLCIHLGAPPNDISSIEEPPAGFDPDRVTSREELAVLHSSQQACVGCHRIIDPAGFGYENWDAAGRYRLMEKGDVVINAAGTLPLNQGEELVFQESVGFVEALVNSASLRQCVSKHFMTYVIGEEPSAAEHQQFYEAFEASNGAIDELIELVVTTPSFSTRHRKE